MSDQPSSTATSILRLRQVSARVGLSRSSIYRRIADGSFPKPISIGVNSVGWKESAIIEWLAACEAATSDSGNANFTERAKKAAAVRWKNPEAGCAPLCVSAS